MALTLNDFSWLACPIAITMESFIGDRQGQVGVILIIVLRVRQNE
jgi:hypothetical protein